jgi:hypothetical protein
MWRACVQVVLMLSMLGGAPSAPAAKKPDHLWAEDAAAFLNRADGRHAWIVGKSTGPCVSVREATEQACRDAAREVMPRLESILINPRRLTAEEREIVRRRLESDLMLGRLVSDRSVSRVQRPYGELWNAAVLVDASSQKLAPLASEYASMLRSRRVTFAQRIAASAGIFAVILGLYALVNGVTKGYFRGRLRWGAVASLLLAGLAMAWWTCSAAAAAVLVGRG